MNLTFDHVHKNFGALHVVDGFSSEFKTGEVLALVGPPGCGTSAFLPAAGAPDARSGGVVRADGRAVAVPPPGGTLVLQEHALCPWLRLRENGPLAFEVRHGARAEAREAAVA